MGELIHSFYEKDIQKKYLIVCKCILKTILDNVIEKMNEKKKPFETDIKE